jgi:uncharacterized protein Smg (DUF494 family)
LEFEEERGIWKVNWDDYIEFIIQKKKTELEEYEREFVMYRHIRIFSDKLQLKDSKTTISIIAGNIPSSYLIKGLLKAGSDVLVFAEDLKGQGIFCVTRETV